MKRWLLIALIALTGVSCKMVRELSDTGAVLAHGEVIARVGKHRLHRSELEKFIPTGVSPEDSTGLAQRYIKAWAEELILLDMADKQLSVKEKDLTEEKFIGAVRDYLDHPDKLRECSEKAASLHIKDTKDRIMNCLRPLIKA